MVMSATQKKQMWKKGVKNLKIKIILFLAVSLWNDVKMVQGVKHPYTAKHTHSLGPNSEHKLDDCEEANYVNIEREYYNCVCWYVDKQMFN